MPGSPRTLRSSASPRLGRSTLANGVAPLPAVPLPHPTPRSNGQPILFTPLPPLPHPTWLPPTCPPPDVTVIIRYHDEPQSWLDGAVASVLTQPGVSCEVLIVDDGSQRRPDPPADPRVGLLVLPHNAGPSVGQNEGLRRARGVCVRMLSADDELPPHSLAAQARPVLDDPRVMISFGLVVPWDGGDWPQNRWLDTEWNGDPATLLDTLTHSPRTVLPGCFLWRRSWTQPELPADFVLCEDAVWFKTALVPETDPATVAIVRQPVLRYRVHAASLSGDRDGALGKFKLALGIERLKMGVEATRLRRRKLHGGRCRVLYADQVTVCGGAQWSVMQVAAGLDRQHFDVLWTSPRATPATRWLAHHGVPVLTMPAWDGEQASYQAWLAAEAREYRPDVVDVPWFAGVYRDDLRGSAGRTFAHAQSTNLYYSRLSADWPLDLVDQVIAVSDDVARLNPHLAGKGVTVIPNPVDGQALNLARYHRPRLRHQLGLADDDLAVVWSGRLFGGENRLQLLRQQIERYQGQRVGGQRVQFLVAGNADPGPELDAWRAWCAERGVWFSSELWPWQTPAIYAAADIWLGTFELAGLSLSLLEGMAAGCLVVAPAVGGVRSVVEHEVNGLVVEPAPEAVAAGFHRALHLPTADRHELGRLARLAAVARCDLLAAVRRHELLYLT